MNTAPDPLTPLLKHFSAHAELFFAGSFCTRRDFGSSSHLGSLHLVRSGKGRIYDASGIPIALNEPTLIFYVRPQAHWFEPDPETGVDLVCAAVRFSHRPFNPVVTALEDRIHRPLAAMPMAAPVLSVLFSEAFSDLAGRQHVLNRLFEVVIIELLRGSLSSPETQQGMLLGLAHPQLSKAITAIHAEPERPWDLNSLSAKAGMSRSGFAAAFKTQVGMAPGDYLTQWRVRVAQTLLRQDLQLKQVAERVGYQSQPGFLRAFKRVVGESPTAWRRGSGDTESL